MQGLGQEHINVLLSTHFSFFLMGLLFTTWNLSDHKIHGLTRAYFSLYHLFIWLHKSSSKGSQGSSMTREICKWYFSPHNPETIGNSLTLLWNIALLWSSSMEGENCWCLTQQICSITVLGVIRRWRNRVHFKHMYIEDKWFFFSEGRRELSQSSLAPPQPL